MSPIQESPETTRLGEVGVSPGRSRGVERTRTVGWDREFGDMETCTPRKTDRTDYG